MKPLLISHSKKKPSLSLTLSIRVRRLLVVALIGTLLMSAPVKASTLAWESLESVLDTVNVEGRLFTAGGKLYGVSNVKSEIEAAAVSKDSRRGPVPTKPEVRKEKSSNTEPGTPGSQASISTGGSISDPQDNPIPPALPLPDGERESLYLPENQVGVPPGRTPPGNSPPVATLGREMPGSSNFNFSLPVVGLPGRGLNIALSLVYNSRLWNKSKPTSTLTRMRYNVDGGMPAPGFVMDFGRLLTVEDVNGNSYYEFRAPDGTRHRLGTMKQPGVWSSSDGTFITYNEATRTLMFTDGTKIIYGNSVKIVDRNGNYIEVFYRGVSPGQIDYVVDTLGREVRFRYDAANNDLVTVEVPGYDGSAAPRQVMRFYYETITINTSGSFASGISSGNPSTQRVLRYVYYPGTQSGYRYDYSIPYGMIYRITQLRGMQVSTSDIDTTGAVVADGQSAAVTEYDYPITASGLSDVPAYTRRTDDWAGRTSGMMVNGIEVAPYHTFAVNKQQGTTTVTSPDGTVTETGVIVNRGAWDDGLIKYVEIKKGAQRLKRLELDWQTWELDNSNQRVKERRIINDANQTTTSSYIYYPADVLPFNNIQQVVEKGFSGEELRRTEMVYETEQDYRDRGLVYLLKSQSIYAPGSKLPASLVEYDYDETPLSPCEGITKLDDAYTDVSARGNITTVTTYADAATKSGPVINTSTYNLAGNVLMRTANCCNREEYIYSPDYNYAYVTEEKRGNAGQLTRRFSYDRNTGLNRSMTDENGQVSGAEYEPASLRVRKVTSPDGGYTTFEYQGSLVAGPAGTPVYSYVKATSALDNVGGVVREISRWQYMDGRGAVVRSYMQTPKGYLTSDIEYDVMGRPYRSNNPYLSATLATSTVDQSTWTTREFDSLGRVLYITTADGNREQLRNVIRAEYAGSVFTLTDQAGKQRRQIMDALGRITKVDEPDDTGNLGAVDAPTRRTLYDYDVLDNLTHIEHGLQHRYFKYDSLGRLIRQKQAEAVAVFDDAGNYIPGGHAGAKWSSVFVYNAAGRMTDAYDARNVHTRFDYTDGMNRLTEVSYSDGTPKAVYTYDEPRIGYFNAGRLTKVETKRDDGIVQTAQTYDYDLMGRVARHQQKIDSETYQMTYGFNLAGELVRRTYPSGRVVEQSFDATGRLSTVKDADAAGRTYANSIGYGPHGGITSLSFGNGTTQSFTYDGKRLQMTGVKLAKEAEVLEDLVYKYGQVDATTGTVDATKNTGHLGVIENSIGGALQWQQRISYDPLGRLRQVSEHYGTGLANTSFRMEYGYDRYGNRRMAAGQTQALAYTPVAAAEIDEETNRFKPETGIAYDDAGQITDDNKFTGRLYAYDANGRMKASSARDGSGATYSIHDALGRRVQTKVGDRVCNYVYDVFGALLAEYENRPQTGPGGVKYITLDGQGSLRVVTDGGGNPIMRRDYESFGGEVGAGVGPRSTGQQYGGADASRQRYAGMQRDDTGLDHTWWRKYDNRSGRWTSPDPYGGSISVSDPQSLNRYSYVQNDPVNFVDPTGLLASVWELSQYGADHGWRGWGGGGFNLNHRPLNGRKEIAEKFNSNIHDFYIKWSYDILIGDDHYSRSFIDLITSPAAIYMANAGLDYTLLGSPPRATGSGNARQPKPWHVTVSGDIGGPVSGNIGFSVNDNGSSLIQFGVSIGAGPLLLVSPSISTGESRTVPGVVGQFQLTPLLPAFPIKDKKGLITGVMPGGFSVGAPINRLNKLSAYEFEGVYSAPQIQAGIYVQLPMPPITGFTLMPTGN